MILELLLILGIVGIIFVFFYKQAVQEFRILQTEDLEKAMALLNERCPIVVLPAPAPQQLWTRSDIDQRPTLKNTAINGMTLAEMIRHESVALPPSKASALAAQVGLPVWIQRFILQTFKESAWWTPLLTARTEVAIGSQGLRQTFGYSTVLMATDGEIQVSLLNESSDAYLPQKWLGKRVSKLTRDDAPLLAQIEYIDVIVRPGSALLIPPHWKVCWESMDAKKPSLAIWTEIHHPLSKFVRTANTR